MISRIHVATIVALALVVPLTWLWMLGSQLDFENVAAVFGLVVAIVYGAVVAFVRFAWHWRLFRDWFVKRPDLRGTWKAQIHTDWVDPLTRAVKPPVEAYVVIRQTLVNLSMRLFTEDARSILVAHSIELEPDGLFSLSAVYRNTPKIEYQGPQGAIHHGALLIEIHSVRPTDLEGHYWTDRNTRGSIHMHFASSAQYSSFEEAHRALSTGGA